MIKPGTKKAKELENIFIEYFYKWYVIRKMNATPAQYLVDFEKSLENMKYAEDRIMTGCFLFTTINKAFDLSDDDIQENRKIFKFVNDYFKLGLL